METKRLEQLRKHVDGDSSENVELHAKDLCELVRSSGTKDEGLKQAAKSLAGHVGFVVVNREAVKAMLNIERPTSNTEHRTKSK
jgi:hypothetical protein